MEGVLPVVGRNRETRHFLLKKEMPRFPKNFLNSVLHQKLSDGPPGD